MVVTKQAGITAIDEPMIFKIDVANHGYGKSKFVLYHETIDNGDSLGIDGNGLGDVWDLNSTAVGGQKRTATLTIEAGPGESRHTEYVLFVNCRLTSFPLRGQLEISIRASLSRERM